MAAQAMGNASCEIRPLVTSARSGVAAGVIAAIFTTLAFLAILWGTAHVIVGIPLRRHTPWSRLTALMLGSVDLLLLPYGTALGAYALAICREWCRRGHTDTCAAKLVDDLTIAGVTVPPRSQRELRDAELLPPWLGGRALHRSHRSALVRKDPDHYGRKFSEPDDLPYVWPVRSRPT